MQNNPHPFSHTLLNTQFVNLIDNPALKLTNAETPKRLILNSGAMPQTQALPGTTSAKSPAIYQSPRSKPPAISKPAKTTVIHHAATIHPAEEENADTDESAKPPSSLRPLASLPKTIRSNRAHQPENHRFKDPRQ